MARKKKSTKCNHANCCGSHCVFFPQNPSEIIEEYTVDGIKHRKVIRVCREDGIPIVSWATDSDKCKSFESL